MIDIPTPGGLVPKPTQKNPDALPLFSPRQIQQLDVLFPERNSQLMTADQRLWNAAQRNLIAVLREKHMGA